MNENMREILAALRGKRFSLENEKRCQAEIEPALRRAYGARGENFVRRECKIAGGTIDFTVGQGLGRIGIEIKLKGQASAIRSQLRRYCTEPELFGIVLVTAAPVGVPDLVRGKPVFEFDLSRAWL